MAPIIARTALRMAGRRHFSVIQSMRSFARSMEAHPFERIPKATESQAADWGKQVRRVGSQAAVFFPAYLLFLGWPFAAKAGLDGHM